MKSKTKIKKKPIDAVKALEKISKAMNGVNGVKVGLPKGSNDYPDGTSVIMVGAVHEFGSPKMGVPQRSFLRSTVTSNRRKYKALFRKLSKKIVKGSMDTKKALGIIGLTVQTDVRDTIANGISPPLKHREGTALWDSGHLIESIIFKVGD